MSTVIPAFDAKQKLSELLNRAASGEEFVITKHGRPVARLVPPGRGVDREAAREALFSVLNEQRVLKLGRIRREDAYADEP